MSAADGIIFRPIGLVRSEHILSEETPIQPVFARGCKGSVHIFPEFAEGLKDIEGFSHIYLICHLHQAAAARMLVLPFLQDIERGVFATRSPRRPNPIGLSIVELVSREGNVLNIDNTDLFDGTPLLDIKPYSSRFDCLETSRNGWMDEVDESTARDRGRRGVQKTLKCVRGPELKQQEVGKKCGLRRLF